MTNEELKAAIFSLNLKGKCNMVFYDRKMIDSRQLQEIAESWPEDDSCGAVFIGIRVAPGKTLRACVLKRNPLISKIVSLWDRVTAYRWRAEA